CERRRRRRSKTLPDTSDNRDDKGSRRHSRHAGRHRENPAAATPARPKTARGSEAEDSAPTPDFRLSGKLAAEANAVNGVELKYSEPAEARRPVGARWRIYVFKDGKDIDMHHVDSASAFLFGRDRKASYFLTPYLIDLASTNGTYLNGQRIPAQRFVELRSEDVVKLGFSTREYVLLRESPS
ncbi:hypothetical protein H4R23_000267, partial [Coemansia sp. Cherry 401B]